MDRVWPSLTSTATLTAAVATFWFSGPAVAAHPESSTQSTRILTAEDRRSFATLERSLGGQSGVAVLRVGSTHVSVTGTLTTGVAWSTSKVPVAMAAITAKSAATSTAKRAITVSDNAAADQLWRSLGRGQAASRAATTPLRAAGDLRTTIEHRHLRPGFTAFGQTAWRLSDQARFVAVMPCSSAGRQVLGWMGQVDHSQRWGLGSTRWSAQFKGGWGPGVKAGRSSGYMDRQMGLWTSKDTRVAVAIMTRPRDGLHRSATANLTKIANWLDVRLSKKTIPAAQPRCSQFPGKPKN